MVRADGAELRRYPPTDLGLAPGVSVRAVATMGDELWPATSRGLLAFRSHWWQAYPALAPGLTAIEDVALAPDGTVWAIASEPVQMLRLLLTVGLMLLLLLGATGLVLFLSAGSLRRAIEGSAQVRQRVREAVPGLPGEPLAARGEASPAKSLVQTLLVLALFTASRSTRTLAESTLGLDGMTRSASGFHPSLTSSSDQPRSSGTPRRSHAA